MPWKQESVHTIFDSIMFCPRTSSPISIDSCSEWSHKN